MRVSSQAIQVGALQRFDRPRRWHRPGCRSASRPRKVPELRAVNRPTSWSVKRAMNAGRASRGPVRRPDARRRPAPARAQLALPARRDRPDRRGARHAGLRRGAHAQRPGFGGAGESVTAAKRQRLLAAARLYLARRPGGAVPLRRVPGRRRRPHVQWIRDALANSALAALACGLAPGRGARSASLVQSSPLAGFRYHAGAEVWRELRVGDRARSSRASPTTRTTRNAVQVLWRGRKLGYVPAARERGARLGARARHAAARAHQRARRASQSRAPRALRRLRRVESRRARVPHRRALRRKRESQAAASAALCRAARQRAPSCSPKRCAAAARSFPAATAARPPTRSTSPPSSSTASRWSARRLPRSRSAPTPRA